MKIYTKTGDKGETGFFGGKRAGKDHPRIAAYGDVDELNSFVGLARACSRDASMNALLAAVQDDLFDLGAILASPDPKELARKGRFIQHSHVERLEKEIDRMERELPALATFILPGGSDLAARLHVARAVCRRAERRVVALGRSETLDPNVMIYLNRLSDFFFILARWANHQEGAADATWTKKG